MNHKFKLALLSLVLGFLPIFSQYAENEKLIYHIENGGFFDCSASPLSSFASFRTSSGAVNMHMLYNFKTDMMYPALEPGDDLFQESVRSTLNLLWSSDEGGKCRIKVSDEGNVNFYEISISNDDRRIEKLLEITLEQNQLITGTQLAWSPSGKILLSLCERNIPIESDINPASFDFYTLRTRSTRPKNISNNRSIRELHGDNYLSNDFIISGVGESGFSNLYVVGPQTEMKQITYTQSISESWPAVSPNNDFVAFIHPKADDESAGDLYTLNLKEVNAEPVLVVENVYIPGTANSSGGQYQWANDSKGIFFIQKEAEQKNPLSFVNVSTMTKTRIELDAIFISSFAISYNEKQILYIAAGTKESDERISYKAYVGDFHY